jgi:hypothetical protein
MDDIEAAGSRWPARTVTMTIAKRSRAGAAAGMIGLAAAVTAVLAPSAAHATTAPIVLTDAGWHGAVRPNHVAIGADTPLLAGLKWVKAPAGDIRATGTLEFFSKSCTGPRFTCAVIKRPVTVTFAHPGRVHAGLWWTRMSIKGNLSGASGVHPNWSLAPRGLWT